jgi:lysophospholipase L1-like esterase
MINIYCLGNSLTAGYPGYSPSMDGISSGRGNIKSQYQYWLNNLTEEFLKSRMEDLSDNQIPNLRFINKGIPGEVSRGLLNRIEPDLLLADPIPDYVIIVIGTNDLLWGTPKKDIFKNIKKVHSLCKESDILSIGATIPPIRNEISQRHYNKQKEELNGKLQDYFSKENIPYCDLYKGMRDQNGNLKDEYSMNDGIHFTVKGYKKMGEIIFNLTLKKVVIQEYL